MADQGSSKRDDARRAAQNAAKVVLAKHPAVVAGSAQPTPARAQDASPQAIDVGTRNIGRGLQR